MGERGFGIRSGVNKQGWEQSDFPVLCESCLGDNPYIRMTKQNYGKECRMCTRPFTLFKWRSGQKSKFKESLICQTCAKLKNCCQSCLYDLQYHMPLEIRDKYLEDQKVDLPTSAPNRDFFVEQANRHIEDLQLPYHQDNDELILSKLTRVGDTAANVLETQKQICQMFLKGLCNKGNNCLYKHDQVLAHQYQKTHKRQQFDPNQKPTPPADRSITTLIIYKIQNDITEEDIQRAFKPYGEISQVSIMGERGRIVYNLRGSAEAAFEALYNKLVINDKKFRVIWSKFQPNGKGQGQAYGEDEDDGLLVPGQGFKMVKSKFIEKVTQNVGQHSVSGNGKLALTHQSGKAPTPFLPPPNIKSNPKAQQSFLMNIIDQKNKSYPSMDPNHMGGLKRSQQ